MTNNRIRNVWTNDDVEGLDVTLGYKAFTWGSFKISTQGMIIANA